MNNLERTYTIALTKEQLMIIGKALSEMPHKYAAPVFAVLNRQVQEQDMATTPANVNKSEAA